MTSPRANEPAYPTDTGSCDHFEGLTIREQFAAMAMQGLLASGRNDAHADYGWLADNAYAVADAMLAKGGTP